MKTLTAHQYELGPTLFLSFVCALALFFTSIIPFVGLPLSIILSYYLGIAIVRESQSRIARKGKYLATLRRGWTSLFRTNSSINLLCCLCPGGAYKMVKIGKKFVNKIPIRSMNNEILLRRLFFRNLRARLARGTQHQFH